MTLFRKPMKGDMYRCKIDGCVHTATKDWDDKPYKSLKDEYEFVTITLVEPPARAYVNMYKSSNGAISTGVQCYPSRQRADEACSTSLERIACINLYPLEGRFDD